MTLSAKDLVDIFEYLPEQDQKILLEFAEFLKSRAPAPEAGLSSIEPLDIPRPEKESVITAIKRLSETYPMIERTSMLSETSDLMMQHTMTGRSAVDVIDEMEKLFKNRLKELSENLE